MKEANVGIAVIAKMIRSLSTQAHAFEPGAGVFISTDKGTVTSIRISHGCDLRNLAR